MHLDATLLTFKGVVGVVRWGSKVHDATLLTLSRNFQDALGLPKYARPRKPSKTIGDSSPGIVPGVVAWCAGTMRFGWWCGWEDLRMEVFRNSTALQWTTVAQWHLLFPLYQKYHHNAKMVVALRTRETSRQSTLYRNSRLRNQNVISIRLPNFYNLIIIVSLVHVSSNIWLLSCTLVLPLGCLGTPRWDDHLTMPSDAFISQCGTYELLWDSFPVGTLD